MRNKCAVESQYFNIVNFFRSPWSGGDCTTPLRIFAVLMMFACCGCERKETIVDIETPGGQIEVERSVDTGAVDVQVTDKD